MTHSFVNDDGCIWYERSLEQTQRDLSCDDRLKANLPLFLCLSLHHRYRTTLLL